MQETQVPSLSWEDSLEKEMVTHSGMSPYLTFACLLISIVIII